MVESWPSIIIELAICFFIVLGLLLYYARKDTNKFAFLIALISWFFNFAIVIFLPYDIYYTQNGSEDEMPSTTEKMIEYGYKVTFWGTTLLSWLILPFFEEYEKSGEFTVLEKMKSVIKDSLIYYSILGGILALIFIISLAKYGLDYTIVIAKVLSLMFGMLVYFFYLSYSLIKYPKTLYDKINYEKQIKYQEWRVNQFTEKLRDIQISLIGQFNSLKATFENLKELEDKNIREKSRESINNNISSDIKNENKNEKPKSNKKERKVKDYSYFIKKKYDDFSNISEQFGIDLSKEDCSDKKPIKKMKNLINTNKKINKRINDNLKMQCRIRNTYNHWVLINSIFFLTKQDIKNKEKIEKIDDNIINEEEEENKDEKLIVNKKKPSLSLEEEGFIPLENISKMKIFYYLKIKKYLLYVIFGLNIIAAVITLFFEILLLFKIDFLYKILKEIHNIIGLHFALLIPLIYLISMSNYGLFKIKISSYIYMYGHRQTDSVSLMKFSSYIGIIYSAICLNMVQAINQLNNETSSKYEVFFNKKQDKEETNVALKICRFSPCFLIIFILLFYYNIPGKLANSAGINLFEFKSTERDQAIKDGHKYLMKLNKKLKGKPLEKNDNIIFEF